MTPILQLMLALATLIGAAKLGGLLSRRMNQPAVLGELLIGVLLGPTFLNFLNLPLFPDEHLPETIRHLAELGVIFLMFYAGLEIHLEEMLESGRVALYAGVLGVVVPLALGAGVALPFGYELQRALFIGVILTATSVSISAQTLMELDVLRTRPGMALLGAAVVDDVLGILILSIFVALAGSGGGDLASVGVVVLRMVLYLGIAIYVSFAYLPRLARWASNTGVAEGTLAFVIVMVLLFSYTAEALGSVAAITGAFIAGAALSRSDLQSFISSKIHPLAYGFFVPIFFVNIGLSTNARVLSADILAFVVVVTIVAIITKVIGSGAGALAGGFNRRESLQLGVGMISRGEVGLIVASVGLSSGIIGEEVFAVAVIVVLVTTLVTPLLLRLVFPKKEDAHVESRVAGT